MRGVVFVGAVVCMSADECWPISGVQLSAVSSVCLFVLHMSVRASLLGVLSQSDGFYRGESACKTAGRCVGNCKW